MTDVNEIFIPSSPTASNPEQDEEPPSLPEETANTGLHSGTVCYPRGAPNPFSPPFCVWHNHDPRNWAFTTQHCPLPPPILAINPYLSLNFANPETPHLHWDIVHPPKHYARIFNHALYFRRWVKPNLEEHAIRPNVKKAWIVSDHPVLGYWVERWGPIAIKSDNMLVEDILNRIYEYLREPLTPADLSQISSVPGNCEALHYARAQRARDSDELDVSIIARGYERIDVVGGHRRFQGLRILFLPDRSWRLCLSLLPGTLPKNL